MHVMRAYLICPDPDLFLLAIKLQKLKAETDPKLLTLPIIMITAQKEHQTLIQEGTYNSPQSHESRLIALAAKFGGAKATNVSDAYSKGGRSKGKDKGKRADSWMTVAPKDNVITKVVEGKTYHYCPHHKRWGFHQEKDCFVKLERLADTANANSVTSHSQFRSLRNVHARVI
ncbi:hypothetical protein MHU86_1320 [Fragilaria crotonensis]|nr:hypothetical protein MHU86_1320 [Fragilaria crotonensis]